MPLRELPYRGYLIRYGQSSDTWYALLYPGTATKHTDAEVVRVTFVEGEEALLQLAKSRIDAALPETK
jgi:hypothetical protein